MEKDGRHVSLDAKYVVVRTRILEENQGVGMVIGNRFAPIIPDTIYHGITYTITLTVVARW